VYLPKVYHGKDKTFFHLSVEKYKLNSGATKTETVPTQAMIGGDFSAFPSPIFVPGSFVAPAGCLKPALGMNGGRTPGASIWTAVVFQTCLAERKRICYNHTTNVYEVKERGAVILWHKAGCGDFVLGNHAMSSTGAAPLFRPARSRRDELQETKIGLGKALKSPPIIAWVGTSLSGCIRNSAYTFSTSGGRKSCLFRG